MSYSERCCAQCIIVTVIIILRYNSYNMYICMQECNDNALMLANIARCLPISSRERRTSAPVLRINNAALKLKTRL